MTSSPPSEPSLLYALARRRNPRRSCLFVSTVLAKHMTVDARSVLAAGRLLAQRVAAIEAPIEVESFATLLDGDSAAELGRRPLPVLDALVVGFCETAVCLGATVALELGTPYAHSTRYPAPDHHRLLTFTETHSHAPAHVLSHPDPGILSSTRPVILVDDEMTTGKTSLALIEAIQLAWPRERYVVGALLDWRSPDAVENFRITGERIGASIEVVSLLRGDSSSHVAPEPTPLEDRLVPRSAPLLEVVLLPDVRRATPWSANIESTASRDASIVAEALEGRHIAAVLGVEECMLLPVLVAERMGVTAQSTTLSPVVVSSDAGYPIRSAVSFESPFGLCPSWAYNVPRGQEVAIITDGGDPELNRRMAREVSRHTGERVCLVLTADAARDWASRKLGE